ARRTYAYIVFMRVLSPVHFISHSPLTAERPRARVTKVPISALDRVARSGQTTQLIMVVNFARLTGLGVGLWLVLASSESAWAQPEAPAAAPSTPAAAPAPASAEVLKEAGERYARGLSL